MIMDLKESKEMCDWLMYRGLGLAEAAHVICNMGTGDTLCIALIKVFTHTYEVKGKLKNPFTTTDWGNPITP